MALRVLVSVLLVLYDDEDVFSGVGGCDIMCIILQVFVL